MTTTCETGIARERVTRAASFRGEPRVRHAGASRRFGGRIREEAPDDSDC